MEETLSSPPWQPIVPSWTRKVFFFLHLSSFPSNKNLLSSAAVRGVTLPPAASFHATLGGSLVVSLDSTFSPSAFICYPRLQRSSCSLWCLLTPFSTMYGDVWCSFLLRVVWRRNGTPVGLVMQCFPLTHGLIGCVLWQPSIEKFSRSSCCCTFIPANSGVVSIDWSRWFHCHLRALSSGVHGAGQAWLFHGSHPRGFALWSLVAAHFQPRPFAADWSWLLAVSWPLLPFGLWLVACPVSPSFHSLWNPCVQVQTSALSSVLVFFVITVVGVMLVVLVFIKSPSHPASSSLAGSSLVDIRMMIGGSLFGRIFLFGWTTPLCFGWFHVFVLMTWFGVAVVSSLFVVGSFSRVFVLGLIGLLSPWFGHVIFLYRCFCIPSGVG